MLRIAIGLVFVFIGFISFGQVKSAAFRAMLNGLLSHTTPEIGVSAASAEADQILFLDAREEKEFAVSHIAGARFVGYDHFDVNACADVDKNRRIVVYCSVGYRSEKISEKLLAAGFTNVSNLYGGIFEWVNQGHPVYDRNGPTKRVHAYSRTWGIWLKKGEKVYR